MPCETSASVSTELAVTTGQSAERETQGKHVLSRAAGWIHALQVHPSTVYCSCSAFAKGYLGANVRIIVHVYLDEAQPSWLAPRNKVVPEYLHSLTLHSKPSTAGTWLASIGCFGTSRSSRAGQRLTGSSAHALGEQQLTSARLGGCH